MTIGSLPNVYVPGFEPLERWSAVGARTSGWKATDAERLGWLRSTFSPPAERAGPRYEAWLEELGSNPHFEAPEILDFSVVGFKANSQSIRDHGALFTTLLDVDSRVIVLQRHNRIKHALSLYRYHEEGKSQFDESGLRPPSEIDLKVFQEWVAMSVVLHRQSEVFWARAVGVLGREAVTRVRYEEFVDEEGKAKTMDRLARFLGIEVPAFEASLFQKATPDNLEAAVVNYDALVERYRRTEFKQFLSE